MFQCKDLLNLTTMSNAKIISGSKGLKKGIRWAYKAENFNFEKWVHGQELLIISSPVTQRKNFNLYNMIKKAININLSCALLLIGEDYVNKIDDDVKELSNKYDFPIFTIPYTVPLVDFFEELGHAISYLDDRKNIKDNFLAEIIFGSSVNIQSVERICHEMGYDTSVLEQVFIVRLKGMASDDINIYAEKLGTMFLERNHSAIVSSYGDRIIGFMKNSTQCRELITDIFKDFDNLIHADYENFIYTCNVGVVCKDIKELQRSFHDVSDVNSVLEYINKTNQVVFYDNLGFYQLVASMENKEQMIRFSKNILNSLISYDIKNKTELIETLWNYFECNKNLQDTAGKSFSHKNTIKYRLKRIREITGYNLDNSYQCLELYSALIIYKTLILSSTDN